VSVSIGDKNAYSGEDTSDRRKFILHVSICCSAMSCLTIYHTYSILEITIGAIKIKQFQESVE
jgi:hypothetical protein